MKLSVKERQLLINQFLLLKKLDKENDTNFYDANSYDNYIKILHNGYEGLYNEIFIDMNHTVPKEVSDEVYNILYMYDRALLSHDKLSFEEKKDISKERLILHGFDGQNERDHLSVYRFLIEDMKVYRHTLKTEDLNSHFPTLLNYRKKLNLFEKYKSNGDILDLEGLKKIFG